MFISVYPTAKIYFTQTRGFELSTSRTLSLSRVATPSLLVLAVFYSVKTTKGSFNPTKSVKSSIANSSIVSF